jgi:hypothetical protein
MPSYLLLPHFHPLLMEGISACLFLFLPRHNAHSFYSNAQYTFIWNGLDYPGCVFPVTKVDPLLDQPKGPHQFLSKEDQRVYELCTSYPVFCGSRTLISTLGRRFAPDVQRRSCRTAACRSVSGR